MQTEMQRGGRMLRLVMRVGGAVQGALYRWSGGRVAGTLAGMPLVLVTTVGRKSGRPRTWPLSYFPDGDDLVVVASAGGHPQHPAWYLNLRANPRVTVQRGAEVRPMIAETTSGADRGRLWARIMSEQPVFAEYQRRTSRQIPVVRLRPVRAGDARGGRPAD